ncbi:HigA family addiction module antitoxin [Rhizobium sp. Rhizsp42]|uniref:HigA family addiction module antitoxin n=1 Tax=Rhizobium sp. Rhizsp42 TaxID=3243034 RepID=UPI0039AF031B
MTGNLLAGLTKDQLAFARSLVDSGRYSSVEDVLQAGLELLHEEIEGEIGAMETLRATIESRLKRPTISTEEMETRVAAIVAGKRQTVSVSAMRDPNRCPIHPGALLRDDLLPAIGKPTSEIANLLGISRQDLDEILREESPVSVAVAVRFGKMFGNGPLMWIGMQAAYDVWHAVREVDVSGIPTLRGD